MMLSYSAMTAVVVVALILVNVAFYGALAYLSFRPKFLTPIGAIGSCAGAGLALLGLIILILGYAQGWSQLALSALSIFSLLGLAVISTRIWTSKREMLKTIKLPTIGWTEGITGLMLSLIIVVGTRPPSEIDELEYHWAAPIQWAQAQHWVPSAYKLTNGPCLAELLYLFSAIFSSSTAAHWTHTLLLVLLLVSAYELTRHIGGSGKAAVLACLSVPTIAVQSAIAYNDTAAAAFALAAYVPLLCQPALPKIPKGNILLSSLLFAAAISTKPLLLMTAPIAALLILFPAVFDRSAERTVELKAAILFALIPMAVGAGWLLHTKHLTGEYFDRTTRMVIEGRANGTSAGGLVFMVRDRQNPLWKTGAAAGRIPDLQDLLTLPFVPLITPFFGQQEPYGGRTGFMLPFFLFGIASIRQKTSVEQTRAAVMLAAASCYFLLVGAFFIKTRFHNFVWSAACCYVGLGFQSLSAIRDDRLRRFAYVLFFLLLALGIADSTRSLLKLLR